MDKSKNKCSYSLLAWLWILLWAVLPTVLALLVMLYCNGAIRMIVTF